jgi:hypothetical protein
MRYHICEPADSKQEEIEPAQSMVRQMLETAEATVTAQET